MNPPLHEHDRGDILVVDDTPENITVLRDILVRAGHRVRPALSGTLALRAIEAQPPDLVLLDIMMPAMDGYQTCRRLKATPAGADIPVLFISALDGVEDKAKAFHTGGVDYVTKPFRAEEVLSRVGVHLRLRNALRQLTAKNRELAEAARLREDVEAVMRHDLKSPLATIISTAEAVGETLPRTTPAHDLTENIRDVGWSMMAMIHRSLDLMKMERGTYELKAVPLDLIACLRQVAGDLRHTPEGRLVPVELPVPDAEPVLVFGEPLLCRGLFRNLLQNAIEASLPGGGVSISLRPAAANFTTVAIANRGEVPANLRARFAQKFATAGKPGGTGLGAYSARLMAEAQGGSLRLDATVAGKTTIEIRLPLATPPQRAGWTSPAAHAGASLLPDKTRILVADDDAASVTALQSFLTQPGIALLTAHDGLSAAEILARGDWDAALIDFEMPGLPGLEVARRYRATGSRAVLLAVTAHDDPARLAACLEAGFDRVLTKPVTKQSLLTALGEALSAHAPSSQPVHTHDHLPLDPDLARLAPDFLATREAPLSELRAALDHGDSTRIHTLAHRLKGSFSLYGFTHAAEFCRQIERAAEAGELPAASEAWRSLRHEVQRLSSLH